MVWRAADPQGNEAAKVRFDVVPYLGTTCLDIGCGPDKVFPHFIGLDSGKDSALFGVEMKPDIVGDCTRISLFAAEAFDTVFSSHTLEHIVDFRSALAEWWRLVRLGGHLILYLPHRDLYPRIGTPGANPDHQHDFAPEDIVAAMREVAGDWDLRVNETRSELREYSFLQVYRKRAPGAGIAMSCDAPRPACTAAVVRLGAYGDALWASSLLPHLKRDGAHVTVFTSRPGATVLAADPHVDRIVEVPEKLFSDEELLLFLRWHSRRFDRFIDLTGVVETRLLPHPNEPAYYWSTAARQREMNRNYLEALHDVAGLPHEFHQRFYATAHERDWARAERRQLAGPVVVIAPTGSGLPKTWPHARRLAELLAKRHVHSLVLGDLRQDFEGVPADYVHVLGTALPIRLAFALAQAADAVVGVESSILNAVAMEEVPKVVLLSHSSARNLTQHWRNAYATEVAGLECHPCHRLHRAFEFCTRDSVTGFAACQAAVSAEQVLEVIAPHLAQAKAATSRRVIPLKVA